MATAKKTAAVQRSTRGGSGTSCGSMLAGGGAGAGCGSDVLTGGKFLDRGGGRVGSGRRLRLGYCSFVMPSVSGATFDLPAS